MVVVPVSGRRVGESEGRAEAEVVVGWWWWWWWWLLAVSRAPCSAPDSCCCCCSSSACRRFSSAARARAARCGWGAFERCTREQLLRLVREGTHRLHKGVDLAGARLLRGLGLLVRLAVEIEHLRKLAHLGNVAVDAVRERERERGV